MFLDWMPHLKQLTLQVASEESFSSSGGEGEPFSGHSSVNWSYTFRRASMTMLNKYPYCSAYGGLDYWNGGIPFTELPLPFTFVLWCDQLAPFQTKPYRGSAYYDSGVGVAIPPDYHPVIGRATSTGDPPPDPVDIHFNNVSLGISGVKAAMGLYCTNNNGGYGLQPGICINREQQSGSVRRTPYQDPMDWFYGNQQLYPPDTQDYTATRLQTADFSNKLPDIQLITLQPNYYPNDQVSMGGSPSWPPTYTRPVVPTAEIPQGLGVNGFLTNPQDFGDVRLMFHYKIDTRRLWQSLLDLPVIGPGTGVEIVCKSMQEVLVYQWAGLPGQSFGLIHGRSVKYAPPPLISEDNRHPADSWRHINGFLPPGSREPWTDPPYTSGVGSLQINGNNCYGQGYIDLESGDPSFYANDSGSHSSEPGPGGVVNTSTWSYYVAATFS